MALHVVMFTGQVMVQLQAGRYMMVPASPRSGRMSRHVVMFAGQVVVEPVMSCCHACGPGDCHGGRGGECEVACQHVVMLAGQVNVTMVVAGRGAKNTRFFFAPSCREMLWMKNMVLLRCL